MAASLIRPAMVLKQEAIDLGHKGDDIFKYIETQQAVEYEAEQKRLDQEHRERQEKREWEFRERESVLENKRAELICQNYESKSIVSSQEVECKVLGAIVNLTNDIKSTVNSETHDTEKLDTILLKLEEIQKSVNLIMLKLDLNKPSQKRVTFSDKVDYIELKPIANEKSYQLNYIRYAKSNKSHLQIRKPKCGNTNLNSSRKNKSSDRVGNKSSLNDILLALKMKLKENRNNRWGISPDCYTVKVKNLPYSAKWQNLKDRFCEIGYVRYAEVLEVNGKSMGVGYIKFSNLADVVSAVKYMDNSWFGGRKILVVPHRLSDLIKMRQ